MYARYEQIKDKLLFQMLVNQVLDGNHRDGSTINVKVQWPRMEREGLEIYEMKVQVFRHRDQTLGIRPLQEMRPTPVKGVYYNKDGLITVITTELNR